eukprot:5687576-Pyramimonas_sp.AAC.1
MGSSLMMRVLGAGRRARTPFHRYWLCGCNAGHSCHVDPDSMRSARSQIDMLACFWLRGAIPAQWLSAPPPPSTECWQVFGISNSFLGPGTLRVALWEML